MNTQQELFEALRQAVIGGDPQETKRLSEKAIEENVDPLLALEEGLGKGIKVVGDAFGCGDMFLPDLIIAAQALKEGSSVLVEELKRRGVERKSVGTIVIGTCAGDVHDIGKTIVATLLTANGFQVFDMGVNVSTDRLVAKARELDADILALSALLTTTMVHQRTVIQAIHQAGLRCKAMVGGGPVTKSWAEEIGADAYGRNAAEAVAEARILMGLNT